MNRFPLRWLLCLVLGLALAMPPAVAMPVPGGGMAPCLAHQAGSGLPPLAAVTEGSQVGHAERGHDGGMLTSAACQLCVHCVAASFGSSGVALSVPESPAVTASLAWPPAPLERLDRPPRH